MKDSKQNAYTHQMISRLTRPCKEGNQFALLAFLGEEEETNYLFS